ncbi:MAG TPA: metal-dependent transcriptional regulator [Desulfurococcales archaeon]|nr:metal-dependent transcriptional regulator [Desulfurococcales archaeon]
MYILVKNKGVIRVKDLSRILNVKPASVVEYLDKLASKGLVRYEKYGSITLTKEGLEIAEEIYRRHVALKEFLTLILGVPKDIAEKDACYIEHGIHDETLDRLVKLVEYFKREQKIMDMIKEWRRSIERSK